MIPRSLFEAEHDDFRDTVRRFIADEVVPHREQWEAQQHVDRGLWNKAGELGMLCMTMPEAYGGSGVDRRYSAIVIEELGLAGDSGVGFPLHSDIVANVLTQPQSFIALNDSGAGAPAMLGNPHYQAGLLSSGQHSTLEPA